MKMGCSGVKKGLNYRSSSPISSSFENASFCVLFLVDASQMSTKDQDSIALLAKLLDVDEMNQVTMLFVISCTRYFVYITYSFSVRIPKDYFFNPLFCFFILFLTNSEHAYICIFFFFAFCTEIFFCICRK